jgi:hypothetical protein
MESGKSQGLICFLSYEDSGGYRPVSNVRMHREEPLQILSMSLKLIFSPNSSAQMLYSAVHILLPIFSERAVLLDLIIILCQGQLLIIIFNLLLVFSVLNLNPSNFNLAEKHSRRASRPWSFFNLFFRKRACILGITFHTSSSIFREVSNPYFSSTFKNHNPSTAV